MSPPEYLKSPISTTLVAVIAVFETLATCVVALRFCLRLKLKQGVKWDDYLALLSLVASWAYAIAMLVVAREIGVDWVKIDPFRAAQKFVEAVSLGSLFLIFVIAPIKISVLLFYNRIFGAGSEKFTIAVRITVCSIVAWGVASFVCQMLIGYPDPKSTWEDLADPKYRFDYFKFGLSVPVISIIFDGLILLFPLHSLRKLHLPMKRKISVLGIFWLGSFCLVTGGVRIYYWYKNADALTDSSDVNVNKWRFDTLVQIWVFLEMTVSIIAACLPTLAPMITSKIYGNLAERLSSLSHIFRRTGSQSSTTRSKGSSKAQAGFQRFGSLEHNKYGSGDFIMPGASTDMGHTWDDKSTRLRAADVELGAMDGKHVFPTTK